MLLRPVSQGIEEGTPSTATTAPSPADDEQLRPPQRAARELASRNDLVIHTSEEWESLRDSIRQLYIEENKTLSAVSRILATKHNFIATPKQYKLRFKQWGFCKNLSTRAANDLLQIKESRESLGKDSIFIRSGHKLDLNHIKKTIRRSKNRTPNEDSPRTHDASPGRYSLPASSLPIGIECRTPSPEPRPDEIDQLTADDSFGLGLTKPWAQSGDFFIDPFIEDPSPSTLGSTAPSTTGQLFSPGHPEAELPPSASDQLTIGSASEPHRDAHLDRLERCYNISQKKLALAYGRALLPPTDVVELRWFKSINALLAVLEPVIGDRYQMAELFLCNFFITFKSHPHFSRFTRLHVLPNLQRRENVRPPIESCIDATLADLGLSSSVRSMIVDIRASDARNGAAPNELRWDDANLEDYINPSALSQSTAGGLSASELEMPLILLDDTSYSSYESHLISEFEGVAVAYPGNDKLARVRLRSITAYESVVVTAKGKVLTRLAWYCLSYLSDMAEEVESCLISAVQGSTYFRDDEGDEWQDVSYLFR